MQLTFLARGTTMLGLLDTFFKIMAVALVAMVIWRVALLFWRVEYAESILARTSEQRKRTLDAYRRTSCAIKPVLWQEPIVAVVAGLAVWYFFPQMDAWAVFAAMLEMALLLAIEYYFETWLIRYVTEHEKAPSGSSSS